MQLTRRLGISPLAPYDALMYGCPMYFDVRLAESELGWYPDFGNAEMFAESYDWYIEHRGEVLRQSGSSHHRSPVEHGILDLLS